MNHVNRLFLVTLAILGLGSPLHSTEAAQPFSHDTFGRVLQDCVRNSLVDYAILKARPAELDNYLDRIAAIRPEDFARWSREDRLALLINLYNAQTLRLIVDHYPVASIKKIGLLPGAAWRRKSVRWGGKVISLDELEHGIIRKEYQEPRIHFALVCAAKGCPPLREEPFVPDRLDEQLQDQGRRFLAESGKNRLESSSRTLWLSPIFDWFADDFTAGGKSIVEFVRPMLPEATRQEMATLGEPKVRFTEYDWSLNDQANP
jgi:hypothetical protein